MSNTKKFFGEALKLGKGNLEAPGRVVKTHMGRDALLRLRSGPVQARAVVEEFRRLVLESVVPITRCARD